MAESKRMMKRPKVETYVLACLLAVLIAALYFEVRPRDVVGLVGVHASDGKFQPLNISDPALRLDLLSQMQKEEYRGEHRNIFSAEPLPPPPSQQSAAVHTPMPQPIVPAGPPPLVVPASFYGIVTDVASGQRKACFSTSDDNIYILPEGGTLLSQFRVLKIGNNSVDLEEISSGRRTTLVLTTPDLQSQSAQLQP